MKKVYILIAVIIICTAAANIATAQKKRYPVHELSVSLSGGQSNLLYKLDESSHSGGFGGGLDLGYTYNIKRLFGIVTGFGFSVYNSKLSMNEYSERYTDIDDAGDEFTFNCSFDGYSEKQSVILFSIPVMMKYSVQLGKKGDTRYCASGGIKVGIPLNARSSINTQTVTTSGYYAFEDGTYTDLPEYGFVNGQAGEQSDCNIKLNVATLLALETGIRIQAGYQKHFMAGIYLDYSLNNMQKVKNRHVLEYQSSHPSLFQYNSIINTERLKKVNLFSFGLKVGLSF
jgi:opacity protein-like surface antigen